MRQQTELTLTDALKIISIIIENANTEKAGLAVAVVDSHGELIAFARTDNCRLPSITIAQNKAYTAAREQIDSKELGRRSKSEGFPMTNFGSLNYVSWGGGIPIEVEGQIIGAVGVSGLPEADDIRFAQMGIDALQTDER